MDSIDSRFGLPDDWGLTPARHREIANELGDHLDCLRGDEGGDKAREAEARLSEPQVRRKLSTAHIADQVVATLQRLPNREERRELGWLLSWFLIVIANTWVSDFVNHMQLGGATSVWTNGFFTPPQADGLSNFLGFSAWLLSAISRAGFISLLVLSMLRAWRTGPGVCIARQLQYKLIHTVLVLGGMLLIRQEGMLQAYNSWNTGLPSWLNHMTIAALLGLLVLWALAGTGREPVVRVVFCLLLFLFLVPSGPRVEYQDTVLRPIATKRDTSQKPWVISPDDSPGAVEAYLENNPKMARHLSAADIASNRRVVSEGSERTLGPVWSNYSYQTYNRDGLQIRHVGWEVLSTRAFLYAPVTHPGSGLAWLALPLPFMGVVGFFCMVLIMGRRNIVSIALYSILCLIAIATTIMPFTYAQPQGQVLLLNLEALVHTPLPGFEELMVGYSLRDDWMLVLGLLFSAGIPWLLTGLFLRGEQGNPLPVDDDADLATG